MGIWSSMYHKHQPVFSQRKTRDIVNSWVISQLVIFCFIGLIPNAARPPKDDLFMLDFQSMMDVDDVGGAPWNLLDTLW